MKSKYYLFVFFSFLLLFFCGKPDQTYTIEFKDGVKHIHNLSPAWGDTLKIALEFVQKIGELEGEDENYMFYLPNDVAKDDQGNIYVLDMGNYRIQKFDENGKYLAIIGKKGEGPGELMRPWSICIDSESTIYVPDTQNDRIQMFSTNGIDKGSFRMQQYFQLIRCLKSGDLVPQIKVIPDPRKPDTPGSLLAIMNNEGEIVKRFGKVQDYGDANLNSYTNDFIYDVDSDDNIIMAFRYENKIDKYAPDGTIIFSADRPLNFDVENKIEMQKHEIQGRIMELAIPQLSAVSAGIGVDHKGRIWTVTYKKQPVGVVSVTFKSGEKTILEQKPEKKSAPAKDEQPTEMYQFEIFDNNGVLLGKHPAPVQFGYMRIFGDRLYLIDPTEELCVYEYKIVEK